MELGRRQILHYGVTAHPTAEWTLQQFREALPGSHPNRFVLHDRDSIYSRNLDQEVAALGVRILRTPRRAPKANSRWERLVGTARRECLDWLIPLGEGHLRRILKIWITHYNQSRAHMSDQRSLRERLWRQKRVPLDLTSLSELRVDSAS